MYQKCQKVKSIKLVTPLLRFINPSHIFKIHIKGLENMFHSSSVSSADREQPLYILIKLLVHYTEQKKSQLHKGQAVIRYLHTFIMTVIRFDIHQNYSTVYGMIKVFSLFQYIDDTHEDSPDFFFMATNCSLNLITLTQPNHQWQLGTKIKER